MAIPVKDQKILWAKAAGRCSMPDCRIILVEPGSASVPSGNVVFGENCHIVGESAVGPRGKSSLGADDRNRYPNLILLCANHHTLIDQDPDSWPLEILHQTKSDHELWVETQLAQALPNTPDDIYADLVNRATEGLRLQDWNDLSDAFMRGIVPEVTMDASNDFTQSVFAANWPGTRPELEVAIRNFAARLNRFLIHFAKHAELVDPPGKSDIGFWRVDRASKRASRMSSREVWEGFEAWEDQLQPLLADVVVALNEFAQGVRDTINANYFLFEGKFLIVDSLGVTNDMTACSYLPETYSGITDDQLVE